MQYLISEIHTPNRYSFSSFSFSAAKLPQPLIIPLPAACRNFHALRQIFAGMNRRVFVQVADQLAAAVGDEEHALPVSGVKLFFNPYSRGELVSYLNENAAVHTC